jgi:hypothetical protein
MKIDFRNPAASAIAAAVILLVAGPGWWLYSESVKEEQRMAVAAMVAETTRSIALGLSLRGAEGEAAELDKLVAAAEAPLSALRDFPGKREPAVFEAAEQYLTDAQRAQRRQAMLVRVREVTAASQNALMMHMARSDNRSDEWIRQAVALRQKLEKDFFDYRISSAAYSSALDAMPASRRRLAEVLPGAALYDEAALGKVQTRAADDAKIAAEELEALKRLPPPR